MGLAAAADIVIATPRARFALAETSLGLPPAQIAPYLVARLGERVARRLALTGARLDGAAKRRRSDSPTSTARRTAARQLAATPQIRRALRARRQRRNQAAVRALPRCAARRLYRASGRAKLRRRRARRRGARGARGVPRKARAGLGEPGMTAPRFDALLIANRGEIACRIIRAARAEGLRDRRRLQRRRRRRAACAARRRRGPHRPGAGRAILSVHSRPASRRRKPPAPSAIHPGYGFLAENADFARSRRRQPASSSSGRRPRRSARWATRAPPRRG